jgi:hypothetical protein
MLRTFLAIVLLLGVAFYFLANHSIERTVFICQGDMTANGVAHPQTVFIAFDRYRWWVIWGASHGNVHLELADGTQVYYSGLDVVSTGLHIFRNGNLAGAPDGIFSSLSKTLRLTITSASFFEGACTPSG